MDIRRRSQIGGIKKTSSSGGDTEIGSTAIYYTSSDGNIVTPYSTTVFGANIVSNNYINGQGIISFDGPVTTIGSNAFYECYSLTSITIPNSVTTIGNNAFSWCDRLASITIPDNVTEIGDRAFFACENLTTVTIGNSVITIGECAFEYCISLTTVTIGNSVTEIGVDVFAYCSSLTSVYCKAITPPVGNYGMFSDNASGRKIYVPMESVEAYKSASYWSWYASDIVGYDFEDDGDIEIDTTYTIYYTSSNGNIVTPYKTDIFGANIISNNYINGQGIISFDGPVTTIGGSAFSSCWNLISVTIPDSVTSIGSWAFYGCNNLTSVTIGDSVTTIGNYAFYNCYSLTSVYCKVTTPPSLGGTSVFDSNGSGRKIFVPAGSVNAYKSATNWSEYASAIVGYNF